MSVLRPPVIGPLAHLFVMGALACAGSPASTPATLFPDVPAPAASSGPVCRASEGPTVVTFPDASLERAVRAAVAVGAEQPLTCAALAGVTRLHAPDGWIESLSGIENLVHLRELYVYGSNSIRDVTPLSFLAELSDLNLARNQIEDIGPLAAVHTLTSLDLLGNPVRDIRPLGHLTGLTRLRIQGAAHLADLSPLGALTQLTRLDLGSNAIMDVGPLAGLVHLTRLTLEDNPALRDITPLGALTGLESLYLSGTSVSDLRPLSGLSRLTSLMLDRTHVSDLGVLISLPSLTQIDLRGNARLVDIQPLLFHTSLGADATVRLESTPVTCTDVAALQIKGVRVFADCR